MKVKKRVLMSCLLVGIIIFSTTTIPAIALAENVDKKIEQKENEISKIKNKKASLVSETATLEASISSIFDKGLKLKKQQSDLELKSKQLNQEINLLNERIKKRSIAIKDQARDVQVNGQSTTFIDAVINAESVSDAIGRVQAISTIMGANNKLITQQKTDKELVEKKQTENIEKIQKLKETKLAMEAEKKNLLAKQSQFDELKASLDSEQATAEKSKSTLNKQKDLDKAAKDKQIHIATAQQAKKKEIANKKVENVNPTKESQEKKQEVPKVVSEPKKTNVEHTNTSNDEQNKPKEPVHEPEKDPKIPTPPPVNDSSDATLQALNALRTSHGLKPVSWDGGLAASAAARAALVEGSNWTIPSDHWSRGDEVIAMMFAPGESVIMAWYNETNMTTSSGSGHRDWEMNPSITRVGFGYSGSTIVGHSA